MRHNRYDGSKEVNFFPQLFQSCKTNWTFWAKKKKKRRKTRVSAKGVVSREIKKNPTKWKQGNWWTFWRCQIKGQLMKEVNFKRQQLFNACTPHIHHCYCKGPGKTSSSINTWECCCNLHHSVASKASKGGPKKWKTPPFSFHYLYLVIYYIFFFFDLSSFSFVS